MSYKVGDEVLVKTKIIGCSKDGVYEVMANRATILETSLIDKIYIREDDIVKDKDMTAEEAWEIAKKILLYPSQGGYNSAELEEIFGRTKHLWELAPQEAKAKIEAWEAAKEIKVGDVVIRCGESCIVTNKSRDDGFYDVLFEDGTTGAYQRSSLKKTGSHIDIDRVLKQIGGGE